MKSILLASCLFAALLGQAQASEKLYCGGNADGYQLEIEVDSPKATIRYVYPDGTFGKFLRYTASRLNRGYMEFFNHRDASFKIDARLLERVIDMGEAVENPTGNEADDTYFLTCFFLP